MITYEGYLKEPQHLTFDEMREIHEIILTEIDADPEAREIYLDLIGKATDYACIRVRWPQLSRTEKIEQDPGRTACHDSLIVKFNMLARYLRLQGKEATWRDILGDEADNPYNRKRIGDFGCYLAFVNALNAR